MENNRKVAFVLNAKKETSYLFADIINFDYRQINPENKPIIIANLDDNIGLPRIREHAKNIKNDLSENNVKIDYITGGLDEYPVTPRKAEEVYSIVSNIVFSHPNSEDYQHVKTRKALGQIRVPEICDWGTAEYIQSLYK